MRKFTSYSDDTALTSSTYKTQFEKLGIYYEHRLIGMSPLLTRADE